ncbi:MAG: hypothetical protein FWG70_11670 [Oscillospiraceae bacterium]|nr:hypothetical protein [Oscillospiraceae bacterium]
MKKTFETPLLLQEGPTRLRFEYTGHFQHGRKSFFQFYNIGGISKGLEIFFIGDCFENDGVEISELEIKRLKKPKVGQVVGRETKYPDDYEVYNITLEKIEFPDGRFGRIVYLDDYVFFEGINLDHPCMINNNIHSKKSSDIIQNYCTSIHYTTTVVSGLHRILFGVAPKSNWNEGQISRYSST